MNNTDLSEWIHDHLFDEGSEAAEKSTRLVMWITAAMMLVEIVAGWWFNSMALLADGWHMSSHAVAIGLSAFAYTAARRYAQDPRFSFGTWKIEVLAGFTSAVFLIGVAALMVFGSIERLMSPEPIHYQEAIAVGVLGLVVNLVCAWVLGHAHHGHGEHGGHHHGHHNHGHKHDHGHDHSHDHGHAHDHGHGHSHDHAHCDHDHVHDEHCNHGHHHHHDDDVKSFVYKSKRQFDPAKLEDFLGAIVNIYGPKMLRYKGVLNMKGTEKKVIFQGVHQLMGSDLGPDWAEGEERISKMVFIGIDLPKDILIQGLDQSLV